MISPERLRRYPHCAGAGDELLGRVAMIADEKTFEAGERLFEEGQLARHLLMIESGKVDIVYRLPDGRDVVVDTLIDGDIAAWSALLEPYRLTASGVARTNGRMIAVEAEALRALCQGNAEFGLPMMTQIAKTLRDRLAATRVQLAAIQPA
jgi:CRP-like cAMP-binding protein